MLYNKQSIKFMLEHYRELDTDLQMDLDQALSSTLLEPLQLAVVGLHYNIGLNLMEVAQISEKPIEHVLEALDNLYNNLEALMNGYQSSYRCFTKVSPSDMDNYFLSIETIKPFSNLEKLIPEREVVGTYQEEEATYPFYHTAEDQQINGRVPKRSNGNDRFYQKDNSGPYKFLPMDDKILQVAQTGEIVGRVKGSRGGLLRGKY